MGFNKRAQAREREAARRAEAEQRRREQGRDVVQAQKLVAVWNSRAARKTRPFDDGDLGLISSLSCRGVVRIRL
jgi:hypothetical protein